MDDLDEPGCPVCGAPGSSCRDVMNASGGLRIVRLGEVEVVPMVRVESRLWKTADGMIVPDGDPRAAVLFATAGDEISEAEADELGIGKPKAKVTAKATKTSGRKHRESVEEAAEDAEKE
jgi:hypothetical protein